MKSVIEFIKSNKAISIIGLLCLIFAFSHQKTPPAELNKVVKTESFKEQKVIVDGRPSYLKYEKNYALDQIEKLKSRIAELEKKPPVSTAPSSVNPKTSGPDTKPTVKPDSMTDYISTIAAQSKRPRPKKRPKRKKKRKKTTFPVSFMDNISKISVPKGARNKAILLTGMQSGYNEREPVLIAFEGEAILPNNYAVDLSGCVGIGKAVGDGSKERVCINVKSLACFSPDGTSVERVINAFIADDKDSTHCAIGRVNHKGHSAVYKTALASVIAGAGKILQAGASITTMSPLGAVVQKTPATAAKNILGGAIAPAAQTMADWWLAQAHMLMPTIDVDAGRPVWMVHLKSFDLPKSYLKQKRDQYEEVNNSLIL